MTILREWVQETWQAEECVRLMVVEALFAGGWRNRDTWQRFDLRDETAVAGIKFRALKRLRELAARVGMEPELREALAAKLKNENGLDYHSSQVSVNCGAKHSCMNAILATIVRRREQMIPA